MVRIYVGPERALWVLPEQILCDHVKYFDSAFRSGFREGNEKVLQLPEDDPLAFAYIIEYVMQQWVDERIIKELNTPEAVHMAWCKTWILADKMGYSKCLIYIEIEYREYIEKFNKDQEEAIPPAVVAFVYDNTSEGCTLQAILFEAAAGMFNDNSCSCKAFMARWSKSAASHPEYLSDVMIELKKWSGKRQAGTGVECGCIE